MTNEKNISSPQNRKKVIMISVNFILSLISVYLLEFWFKQVIKLETLQIIENISIVFLTALTYFVGKTYYIKGVMNTARKIFTLILLIVSILGLMLLSVKTPIDVIYPFSGVIIISVGFYMLSLTTGTLNTTGLIGLSLISASIIAFLKWFDFISMSSVISLSQLSIFIILFIGGTWAEIRSLIHGIRGVNSDGGGFGDESDGSGDIEGEED